MVNYVAEVAIADLYENCTTKEQAQMLPVPEPISATYPDPPHSYNEAVLSANYPAVMSIEDAKRVLEREQKMHWTHLEKTPKIGPSQRQGQNRINKYISRWKNYFFLETAEDYYILTDAIRRKRNGLKPQQIGRQRNPPPPSEFARLVSN